jgi:hypothetical protein
MSEFLLDRAARRRSPATLPGFHAGYAPGNKGLRYPADPPRVEEIIAVMRAAGDGPHGRRLSEAWRPSGRHRRLSATSPRLSYAVVAARMTTAIGDTPRRRRTHGA